MPDQPAADFSALTAKGYQIEFHSHAKAILTVDFPDALAELEQALTTLTIPIEEIIAGGGGEAKGTQRLRRALNALTWVKTKFEVKKVINNREREAISHEIDHVRELSLGSIALEIEWNNKTRSLIVIWRTSSDSMQMAQSLSELSSLAAALCTRACDRWFGGLLMSDKFKLSTT